jgi:hypothetical protein
VREDLRRFIGSDGHRHAATVRFIGCEGHRHAATVRFIGSDRYRALFIGGGGSRR